MEEVKKADNVDSTADLEPETAEMKDEVAFHFDGDEEGDPFNTNEVNQTNQEGNQDENQEENQDENQDENQEEAVKLDFTSQRVPSLTSLPSCSSGENVAVIDNSSNFFIQRPTLIPTDTNQISGLYL